MTPADLAMKQALEEGAQYGRLTPATVLSGGYATFTTRYADPSGGIGISSGSPLTSQVKLPIFLGPHRPPLFPRQTEPGSGRVREKQPKPELTWSPLQTPPASTGSTSSSHNISSRQLPSSLLPILPSTPASRIGVSAPSLSSTGRTIQSEPIQTPTPHSKLAVDIWNDIQRLGLNEAVHSKRKFSLFKQAKRLPHSTEQAGGGKVWQVHAVVFDAGDIAAGSEAPQAGQRESWERSAVNVRALKSTRREGRSVRFERSGREYQRERTAAQERSLYDRDQDPSLESSFSLSKFQFPEPPQLDWPLRSNSQQEVLSTPSSPATLEYAGASFDVVNPHASLILGSREIETPAEIDGLLDDYFHSTSDLSTMLPYGGIPGDMASSQQSFRTTSSNARSRVLYDDPDSARRTIMGIRGDSQSPALPDPAAGQDSPLAGRSQSRALTSAGSRLPSSYAFNYNLRDDAPRPLQIHRNLAEALSIASRTRLDRPEDGLEERGYSPGPAVDRGSSLYPHSQRSDPFPLSVSNLSDHKGHRNIDQILGGNRSISKDVSPVVLDASRERDAVLCNEDVADADADARNQDALEAGTTIGNILDHYNYSASYPPNASAAFLHRDSNSIEQGRGFPASNREGRGERHQSYYRSGAGTFDDAQDAWRTAYLADGSELPTSEQTYGNTGQLLLLTPENLQKIPSATNDDHTGQLSHCPVMHRTQSRFSELFEPGENESASGSIVGQHAHSAAAPRAMLRSSSYYPEDENVWEDISLVSNSRVNVAERNPFATPNGERPSQDSYANTSQDGESRRLSLPPKALAVLGISEEMLARNGLGGSSQLASSHGPGSLPQSDEARAQEILEERVIAESTPVKRGHPTNQAAHEQQQSRDKELEQIRQKNPAAVKSAVEAVARKVEAVRNQLPTKPSNNSKPIFFGASRIGLNREAHRSASSDRQGLLSQHNSPFSAAGLAYSDTANTFQTSPRTPIFAPSPYSPLCPGLTPPSTALLRDRAGTDSTMRSIQKTPPSVSIDAKAVRNKKLKKVSRAAMSSQTELQPLALAESTTSAITGRLTATQLAAAEPGWTNHPDFSRTGALASHVQRSSGFGIQQTDGTVERVSLLMRPDEARNLSLRRLQKDLTRPYFRTCILCPLSSVLFGFGGLDWKMKAMTSGRVTEMEPGSKKDALGVFLVLSVMAWAGFGIMIAMIIVAIQR